MSDVWVAFGLTVFAGMATGIGSIIASVPLLLISL
jgi:hypothetical protein